MSKKTNRNIIILLGLLFAILVLFIFPYYQNQLSTLVSNQKNILLDIKFSYNKSDVTLLFNSIKPEGREITKFISGVLDMIFPLIYGSFFFLLTKKLIHKRTVFLLKTVLLFPILAGLFDIAENFGILSMLNSFPEISQEQVYFASLFTSLKWIFFSFSCFTLFLLVIEKSIQSFYKKNSRFE